jgi:cob(I)alamin adenosyltransferase
MPQKAVAPDIDLDALHQALDGEVDRLPEKYRVPVVLCDLEGRSRKEVAAILKIPEGTLSSRLAKGRELLAHRLARHGLVLSGSMLATVLANQASAVQPALVGSAVQVATSGVVSAQVLALSEGVMKTMFLSKLKVISILALGIVLGSLGAGLLGKPDSLTPAVHAAQPGATQAGQAKSRPETPEPLDGALLLDQQVQKELRLSKNQVQRIQAISQDVDAKSEAKQKEIKELQKQIDDLHKRIEELNGSMSKNRRQIEEQRAQSIGKAAPDILSEKGVTRLRQIQRQQRHLGELLADASMQRMLRIDDEQLKKIESIRKTESTAVLAIAESLDGTNFGLPYRLNRASGAYLWSPSSGKEVLSARVRLWDQTHNWNTPNLQKLFDVLTPAQQTSLSDWLGEPYPGTSWHALKTETKKR